MENQTVIPQPSVVLQPPNQPFNGNRATKNSLKPLLIGLSVVLILIIGGLLAYIFVFNQSKKTTQEPKKEASTSAKTTTNTASNIGYVTAPEGLNMREQPSVDSKKLLLLPAGTEVEIIGTENSWYFIEAQTKGFVSKDYVSSEKPDKTILKVFKEAASPFNFLYPSVYQVTFKNPDEKTFEYSFTSSDSYGGFHIEKETGLVTLGNYALKNYPGAKNAVCSVQFANSRKECEQLATDNGTLYLLLIDNTLYKITYLKTEGGALADINNLVFYSMFFK